jgi:Fe-S-cluster-containing hydrogenase component 2
VNDLYHPLRSLREGNWVKLICGASFQHLPAIRNLTLAYALAGVDCVDVAADLAVVNAARDALQIATELAGAAQRRGFAAQPSPWLMVSLTDGEDPHFRKATFDPDRCPPDCSRPCEAICPAQAIVFNRSGDNFSGVINSHCYGCGRCLPICPIQQIETQSYGSTPAAIASRLLHNVDAVEIHTQVGRLAEFSRLWSAIAPYGAELKLIAISCPDGDGLIDYLWALYDLISPVACAVVWQTDGRPMSGDIGDGATRAAVKLGQKVLAAELPGYVQLAGGTNRHTVEKLRGLGLLNSTTASINRYSKHRSQAQDGWGAPANREAIALPNRRYIAGVAYGSYARSLLAPVLDQLEPAQVGELTMASVDPSAHAPGLAAVAPAAIARAARLETNPIVLWQAVGLAHTLVSQLKSP